MDNQTQPSAHNDPAVVKFNGPTEGAVRAARSIIEQTVAQIGMLPFFKNEHTVFELALLIDEQTGAPEMLAALQSVIAEWREGYGLNCEKEVRAAIAKATGGTVTSHDAGKD